MVKKNEELSDMADKLYN